MKIGIPRALLYYRYKTLWIIFFKSLGCRIVISDETSDETLYFGNVYTPQEACLPLKLYMGHVYNLIDKCDYILVPRITSYSKKENVCLYFNGLYDNVINNFKLNCILNYNLDIKDHKYQLIGFIKMGYKVSHNLFKIIYSYYKAIYQMNRETKKIELNQQKKINNKKPKILIVSHPYVIHDKYLGYNVKKYLIAEGFEIIYGDMMNKKQAKKITKNISPTLYWTYSKELVGALEYYKNKVVGIILLTTFPCGCDSLVNELLLRKINNKPLTSIMIDDNMAQTGIQTRLESFVDIVKARYKYE